MRARPILSLRPFACSLQRGKSAHLSTALDEAKTELAVAKVHGPICYLSLCVFVFQSVAGWLVARRFPHALSTVLVYPVCSSPFGLLFLISTLGPSGLPLSCHAHGQCRMPLLYASHACSYAHTPQGLEQELAVERAKSTKLTQELAAATERLEGCQKELTAASAKVLCLVRSVHACMRPQMYEPGPSLCWHSSVLLSNSCQSCACLPPLRVHHRRMPYVASLRSRRQLLRP